MRKLSFKKISQITAGLIAGAATFITTPVFADSDNCVDTTFFGRQCGEAGIKVVLSAVINIMTAGIAILAVIGIVISGIQYLTASGNEEQLRKSKRRIFEIVIGLVAYVVIYALLRWLLPTFNGVNS